MRWAEPSCSPAPSDCNRGPLRVIKDVDASARNSMAVLSLMAKCLKTGHVKLMKSDCAGCFCRSLQMQAVGVHSRLVVILRPYWFTVRST